MSIQALAVIGTSMCAPPVEHVTVLDSVAIRNSIEGEFVEKDVRPPSSLEVRKYAAPDFDPV
jgi:hypothetical protein